jgi:uncharacterized protein YukE
MAGGRLRVDPLALDGLARKILAEAEDARALKSHLRPSPTGCPQVDAALEGLLSSWSSQLTALASASADVAVSLEQAAVTYARADHSSAGPFKP